MGSHRLLASAMVLAMSLSVPAGAQQDGEDRWQDMPEADLTRNMRDFLQNPMLAPCSQGVGVTQEVARRHPERANIGALPPLARMYCAMSREEKTEALQHYLEFEAFNIPFDAFLGLWMANYAEDHDQQLRQLRLLLVEGQLPIETPYARYTVSQALRNLTDADRKDETSRLMLQAVRAGRLDTVGEEYAGAVANWALEAAMTDDPALVPSLLRRIDDPSSYLGMLADRRYEPIWPQLASRAGPHLQAVLDEQVASTQADLAAEPDSAHALNVAAYALHYAKRSEEVVEMVTRWRARPDAPEDIDEDLAWSINMQGFALNRLGRTAEADQAMAEIAGLDESRHGWVVNFAINHASRIVGNGRYADGLPAVERAREVANRQGSTYARLLVSRDRACALEGLGRHDEAMEEAAYLRENLSASLDTAGTGLLCLGLQDELVTMLAEELADEQTVRDNYALLQRPEADMFYLESVLPSVPALVQGNPQLRELMERHVRVLPDELIPGV